MKLLKITSFVILCSLGLSIKAQQIPLLSHYYIHPFLTNPAMAGLKGSNLFLLNRSPWSSSVTNPETFLISADGILPNGSSAYGLMVYNDKTSVIGKTGAYGTYNYLFPMPENQKLSLGFSLGIEDSKILFSRVREQVPSELLLSRTATQSTNVDANFGAAYEIKGVRLGVAGYQLFNNNSVEIIQGNESKYNYRFQRHFIGNAGYRIVAKPETFFIDPMVQVRVGKNLPTQTTVSLMANYKNKLWAGAGYRQNYGIDVLAGVLIASKLTVGYSYGIASGNSNQTITTAHEIIIGLKLLKNKANTDSDKDGISDLYDREPNTIPGCKVDKLGIAEDVDLDKVPDGIDKQNETPLGAPVDKDGIALDMDKDGVIDFYDREPNSTLGIPVDNVGVMLDGDKDGVPDLLDKELNTHWAAKVDVNGIAIDTDNDKVPDVLDLELETPHWQHKGIQPNSDASKCIVDAHGITKDGDADGVPDCVDAELNTLRGSKVNKKGVSLKKQESIIPEKSSDTDGDGIADELDLEPNTPHDASVDQWGRSPQINSDPASVHRIEIDEIEDNSNEWDYYVIVGVFRYYNNLKNYQKYLLKTYDEPTQVLVTEQNYYYAWTKQITTKADAKNEVQRLSQTRAKDYIVGNPWLWREPKKK